MAIDVGDFFSRAGIDPGAYAPRNQAANVANQPTPKPAGFSPSNLLHSAGNVVGAAASGIAHAATEGFTGLKTGISNNLALRSEGNSLSAQDKVIADKQTQLETAFKNGSITRDQYKQGYKDLLAQSNSNIAAHDKFTKGTQEKYYGAGQTASDYAKAAGTVLTVAAPFAAPGAGALEGIAGASKVANSLDTTLGVGSEAKSLVEGATALPGKLVRNALITQPTVQTPGNITHDIKTGNKADLALQTGLLLAPGVLKKAAPIVGDAVKTALFGKEGSAINGLKFADGTVSDVLSTLSGNAQKKYTKIAQLVNQRMIDEGRSAKQVAQYYAGGNKISQQNVTQFLDQAAKHIQAEKAIVSDTKAGLTGLAPNSGQTVIASRWDAAARKATIDHLQAGGDIHELIANGTIPNNPNLIAEIRTKADSGDLQGINKIFAASPTSKSPELNALLAESGSKTYPGGYVPAIGPNGSANYSTLAKTGELLPSKAPAPVIGKAGSLITKAGLSPVAGDAGALQGAIKDNLKTELAKIDTTGELAGKSSSLYTALLNKAGDTRGVTDIRTLSNRAMSQVLREQGITSITAGDLKSALVDAQLKVPAALQSAGGKLTSAAIKYIPGEKTLLKAQSYGRFALNPIFAGKVAIKSGYLAALDSSGGRIAGPVSDDIAAYVGGKDAKAFGGVVEDALGTPGARANGGFGVDKIQKNIAGNLVQNILQKNGAKLSDIAGNPELKQQVDHAVQMIYGYPKGGFLDSNLAKSLNVAVFPARFEAKVLGATAKAIINQPPVARAMILNGLLKTQNFLNSPEGKQWKKDNSELVDVAKYFTPLDTMSKVMSAVTGQGSVGVKDLGAIGGLPFGVFTQILTDQGVDLGPLGSSEFTPTKTGVPIGRQIPTTTKARIATAMGDLISQSFSYPGAAVGLPSKASVVKNVVGTVSGGKLTTKPNEFKTVGGPAQGTGTTKPTLPQLQPIKLSVPKAPNINSFIKPSKPKRAKTQAKRIGQPF